MQPGQVAMWLTAVVAILVALIGAGVQMYNQRFGSLLSRRTEIDKMYMQELTAERAHGDKLQAEIDDLRRELHETREKLLAEVGARKLLELEQERTMILKRRLIQHGINHE